MGAGVHRGMNSIIGDTAFYPIGRASHLLTVLGLLDFFHRPQFGVPW
jgi:hypothetical protein